MCSEIQWQQIANILTTQTPSKTKGQNKKLRVKILDTVFFHAPLLKGSSLTESTSNCVVREWCFTSRRGEAVKRKQPWALTLQNVYDRFCRFALANEANKTGPKIIAVGFLKNQVETNGHQLRLHFTREKILREVQNQTNGVGIGQELRKCTSIQCYLRPHEGKDHFFRGVFNLSRDDKNADEYEIVVYKVDNAVADDNTIGSTENELELSSKALVNEESDFGYVQNEVELSILRMIQHMEKVLYTLANERQNSNPSLEMASPKIRSLTADFIFDDNQQIWLTHAGKLAFTSSESQFALFDRVSKRIEHSTRVKTVTQANDSILPPLKTRPSSRKKKSQIKNCDIVKSGIASKDERSNSEGHAKMLSSKVRTSLCHLFSPFKGISFFVF
jgi:hypothetical protein